MKVKKESNLARDYLEWLSEEDSWIETYLRQG